MSCSDCSCGNGACGDDIEQKAEAFWQDSLAKFFPKSVGSTGSERVMFKAGFEAGQSDTELFKAGFEAGIRNAEFLNALYSDLEKENAKLKEALGYISVILTDMQYDLETSVYTVSADEFGRVFAARDKADKALGGGE